MKTLLSIIIFGLSSSVFVFAEKINFEKIEDEFILSSTQKPILLASGECSIQCGRDKQSCKTDCRKYAKDDYDKLACMNDCVVQASSCIVACPR